jgi:hypothetical protein
MVKDILTDFDFLFSLLDDNKYIPLYGNLSSTRFSKRIITLPRIEVNSLKLNTIGNIRKGFEHGNNNKIKTGEKLFYFARGVMYDAKFNPLMLIAREKEAFLTQPTILLPSEFKNRNDYVFFYASELILNPEYAALHRRLYKEIVTPYLIKGMEVRIVTSSTIVANTFVRKSLVKKFSSLDKLDNYMKEVLPTFLYEDRVEEPESIDEVERQVSSIFTDTPGTNGEHFNITLNTGNYIINSTTFTTPLTGESTISVSPPNNNYGFFNYTETEEDQNEDDGLTDASWNEELPVEEEALLYGVPGEEGPEIVLYTSAEGAEAIDEAFRASLEQEGHDYDYEEEPEEDIQSESEMEASWFEEQERLVDESLRTSVILSSDAVSDLSTDDVIIHSQVRIGSNIHWRATVPRRRSTWREERIELIDDTTSIELIDDTE